MPSIDRRRFLQLSGGAAALTMLPTSIARAASIPAHREFGDLRDIDHVVVLMQENRSFDHYFGTLRGVRGFGDPHPARQPNGKPVWYQSDGTADVLPFRPDVQDLGLVFLEDLDHSWDTGHAAFADAAYDAWVPAKTSTTMAHLARRDIPFHYALADAFTICDDYHCSLLGPTDPNRYYMWTGWVGNDGKGTDDHGPVIANDELGYSWTTYPERLQQAGVSWKIYQDVGTGLDAAGEWGWTDDAYIGNYGDNSLLYFDQYRDAAPGSPLYQKARTGTDVSNGGTFFDQLEADVRGGRLPSVSWVVAPEAFTEHPNWPANYGAWYVSKVLDALTSDPQVWSRTALLITYDENDGFFDHAVPPFPNVGTLPGASTVPTTNELYTGAEGTPGNYGLGQRVPMTVVSPWSTGGWVCSQTFDHTSIIRLLEERFGVREPNITPWRRAVCGDLTAAFDFARTDDAVPALPPTAGYEPGDDERHPSYTPTPPADPQLPVQEPGVRPSRPVGYRTGVGATVSGTGLSLALTNPSRLGAVVQVRAILPAAAPASYTLGPRSSLPATVAAAGPYDVDVHGPDGFFRHYAGTTTRAAVEATLRDTGRRHAALELANATASARTLEVRDNHSGSLRTVSVPANSVRTFPVDTAGTGGWYDLVVTDPADSAFVRGVAGRVDTGRPGTSDPRLGRR